MAYIDALSSNSYICVNKKLIQVVGLKAATYLSEVMCIMTHVQKKNTLDANGFFKIDRKYVEEQIGLNLADQYECDAQLERLYILKEDSFNADKLTVNAQEALAIITSSDLSLLNSLAHQAKMTKEELSAIKNKAKPAAKKKKAVLSPEDTAKIADGIRENMKNICKDLVPTELFSAYCNWVDAIYDIPAGKCGKSFLTRAIITNFYETVSKYTSDLGIHKQIVDIACAIGYPDHPEYAISSFEKSNASGVSLAKQQKVATAVDMTCGF